MIVYSKFSSSRLKKFQLLTTIERRSKSLVVNKIALNQEALPFLYSLLDKYEYIKNAGYPLKLVRPYRSETNTISFDYIPFDSYETLMLQALKRRDKSKFLELVERYIKLIRSIPNTKLLPEGEFRQVFGDALTEPLLCSNVGCLDLNLDNIFLEENSAWLIDYEWTFDFPIPVDYIIFRAITGFYGNNRSYRPNALYSMPVLLEHFGIPSSAQDIFMKLEKRFQEYVYAGKQEEEINIDLIKKTYQKLLTDEPPLFYTQKFSALSEYTTMLENENARKGAWIEHIEKDLALLRGKTSG